MKRTMMMFVFIALVAMVAAGCGSETVADEKKPEMAKIVVKKAQALCPVMGNPVDKKVYLDYEGKRIYFCCAPCIDKFKEDPAGYIKKMEAEGIGFEKVACTEDHDHGEHGHDHGEIHDHTEGDHDHGEAHDQDKDDDHDGHDHDDHDDDHDDHAGHDHG